MKKIVCFCTLLIAVAAGAQTPKKEVGPQSTGTVSNNGTTTTLTNQGNYEARANRFQLPISDPVIRALNNRGVAKGAQMFGSSSLLAQPKGTYGYSNGRLWLRTTNSTSIGGVTGNSTVGTGSGNGAVGIGANAAGVNGKNPYAGPSMWGSAQGLQTADSLLRRSKPAGRY